MERELLIYANAVLFTLGALLPPVNPLDVLNEHGASMCYVVDAAFRTAL